MSRAIGLVFGGRSVEHEVSIRSARTVRAALGEAGHRVVPLAVAQDGVWLPPAEGERVLDGDAARIPPAGQPIVPSLRSLLDAGVDVVFPIVHGTWGEDGTLQGLCEMLDLPYVGCGVAASAVAMDKILCKQVLEAAGVRVVEARTVDRAAWADAGRRPEILGGLSALGVPCFVKPAVGGSSVGVSKVEDADGLSAAIDEGLRFDDRLLVERGVDGRELECAVLGEGAAAEASVLGEIVPGKAFYDYADKYVDDGAQLIAPAELDDALAERLRRLAVAAFAAVGGSGLARVDFLLRRGTTAADDEGVYVNEINTLPGFTAISMYPRLWELSGVPRPALADRLVTLAVARHAARRRLDEGIKQWIRQLEATAAGGDAAG